MYSPPGELAVTANASTHARLSVGWRLPEYLKDNATLGLSHTEVRPSPVLGSSRQVKTNDSPRRSLFEITTCRWESTRSSRSMRAPD